jgi:hypothetical protein
MVRQNGSPHRPKVHMCALIGVGRAVQFALNLPRQTRSTALSGVPNLAYQIGYAMDASSDVRNACSTPHHEIHGGDH